VALKDRGRLDAFALEKKQKTLQRRAAGILGVAASMLCPGFDWCSQKWFNL